PPSGETAQKRVPARARAGEGSDAAEQARRTRVRRELRRQGERRGDDWPIDVYELEDQAIVELCDVFEAAFGRPARFSFARTGPTLRRLLERFDRYGGPGLRTPDAGAAWLRTLIRETGAEARAGVGSARKINSLAWFLPVLDEASKDKRRWWKRWRSPWW